MKRMLRSLLGALGVAVYMIVSSRDEIATREEKARRNNDLWNAEIGTTQPKKTGDTTISSSKKPAAPSNKQARKLKYNIASANEIGTVRPRAYAFWAFNNGTLPCLPVEDGDDDGRRVEGLDIPRGLLYVKVPKVASSTLASVNLRIARSVARSRDVSRSSSGGGRRRCFATHLHLWASEMGVGRRQKGGESFLWSFVRDPESRAVSSLFFWGVGRNKISPDDDAFLRYLRRRKYFRNFLVEYLAPHVVNNSRSDLVSAVGEIIDQYDFIGVTERMEESIVAMQMLLGLRTSDVVTLPSKVSGPGGSFDGGGSPSGCTVIPKSFVSDRIRTFFETSPEWKDALRYDRLLYRLANRSLDMTIEQFDTNEFGRNLDAFRRASKAVLSVCRPEVTLPCDGKGEGDRPWPESETSCFFQDHGCGFECIDRVLNAA